MADLFLKELYESQSCFKHLREKQMLKMQRNAAIIAGMRIIT